MTAAQKAAADPRVSAWVAASAGTGKTHVLTSRVLRLLLSGARPEGLLCLTFTRAAAAEMANRVQDRLAAWTLMEERALADTLRALTGRAPGRALITRARTLFAEILDVPGGLRILTIHGFCQSLLHRFPIEAGIPPHAAVLDERDTRELKDRAIAEVVKAARNNENGPLAKAFQAIGWKLDSAALKFMVDAIGTAADTAGGDAADVIFKALGFPGPITADELARQIKENMDRESLQAAVDSLRHGSVSDIERGDIIGAYLNDPGAVDIATYRSAYLTTKNTIKKTLATKPLAKLAPLTVPALTREAERLVALDTQQRLAEVAIATSNLYRVIRAVGNRYRALKQARAVLDYDDQISLTLGLLSGDGAAAWVLYKLDGGIDHILVDESQDTNPDQWRIIELIADEFFAGFGASESPRTIFAVGDDKQSIYSFQKADPAQFEYWRGHFQQRAIDARSDFRNVSLSLSFRSAQPVLDFVDHLFSDPGAADGLTFAETVPRHRAHRQNTPGLVELWPATMAPDDKDNDDGEIWRLPVVQEKKVDPEHLLNRRITGQIQRWLKDGDCLAETGRPISAGDILILVRRRTRLVDQLVKMLTAAGIPVAGVDRMRLTDQLAVMDLMALGRFCLLPDDDYSLAVVLKSPFADCGDDDLYALAHKRGGTLWQALRERAGENPRWRAACNFLRRLLGRADFMAPYEFYQRLLIEDGGRQRLFTRLGMEAGDAVDEFLSQALVFEGQHIPSLQGFLRWLESADTEIKRDMEQESDAVRVMTVHGAKGLEAPIVILPDSCHIPRPDPRRPQLLELDTDDGTGRKVPVWPVAKANEVGPLEAARVASDTALLREYRRLLYVALTRARERLYICGWAKGKGPAAGSWYDLAERAFSSLEGVERLVGVDGPVWRYCGSVPMAPAGSGEPAPSPAPTPAALPDWALASPPPEATPGPAIRPSGLGHGEMATSPRAAPGGDDPWLRGRLVHRLLELLPELDEGARDDACGAYLHRYGRDLAADARQRLGNEVMNILRDRRFGALFGPGSEAEVAIAGHIGDRPVVGQIDRLLVADDQIMIVDYKTRRPVPPSPADVPLAYLYQLASYRAVLRQLYPDRKVSAALLWTDGAVLMPIDSDRLAGLEKELAGPAAP